MITKVPLIRTLLDMIRYSKNPTHLIERTMKEFGDTYKFKMAGFGEYIMSSDPKLVEHVFVSNQKNYIKSDMQTVIMGKYLGKGLLTVNGDYWLRQRRTIQPAFHKEKLIKLVEIMNSVIDNYIDELKVSITDEKIDIRLISSELALRVVTETLFNSALNKDEIKSLHNDILFVQGIIVKDIRQPFLKFYRYLSGEEKLAKQKANCFYSLINKLIEERKKDEREYNDLLDMFLSLKYEDTGKGMTNQQILDEILIFFVAGHETVANTLSWCLYFITRDNEVKKKMENEFKNFENRDILDFQSLINFGYTQNLIDESLRLFPPAWYFDRVAIKDDIFENMVIKKGTLLGIFAYGTHRNEKYWENPQDFNPERFNEENKKNIIPYSYYPFGKGPRFCIGQQFAMFEMKIALFKLFEAFIFETTDNKINESEGLVTLKPKYPINLIMTLKKGSFN